MTKDEAIEILVACKALADRASAAFPAGLPANYPLTGEDLSVLQGFDRVQNDPIAAGPGLLNRLFKAAELNQVEVYKLEQLRRMVSRRRYLGRSTADGHKQA